MSLTALQYNKQLPGLRTRLNSSNTIPKFGNSSTSTSASTSTTTTTASNNNSVKYSALSSLKNTTSRQTLYSTNSILTMTTTTTNTATAARVGGKRNVQVFDYNIHNVVSNLDVSIENGFAPTVRSL